MSLPAWAQVTPARRAHIERVAALLREWAEAIRVPTTERDRWLRAAWLHDALRDAPLHGGDFMVHGPAAAERAAVDGERDRGVLDAVRYHTVGYAGWDDVGRMLYLADFLEPGRDFDADGRRALAGRVPAERDAVLREVARRRVEWVLRSGWRLLPETVAFWNSLVAPPR
ncbi:MAG TPA: HD domain-containing protein [Gemmatimonadales bacterium]|nr:HD domain-containing protein [Gemmatimonadales bacterium]